MMLLRSVNISLIKRIISESGSVSTGIFKQPAPGRVLLRTLNLEGDAQADLGSHGGVYQAVYAYPIEHYGHWSRELGRSDMSPGQFGENFTVEGMLEDAIHVGDVFRVGGAMVEVTQPRIPCYKLALKMGSAQFPRQFLASGRVGFYLRVLEEGEVGVGDAIEPVRADPEAVSMQDLLHLRFFEPLDADLAQRALHVRALSPGWRGAIAERLARQQSNLP
jgi:MOSC domain-containing protein YiiM